MTTNLEYSKCTAVWWSKFQVPKPAIPAEVAHGLATLGALHLVAAFFLEEPGSKRFDAS